MNFAAGNMSQGAMMKTTTISEPPLPKFGAMAETKSHKSDQMELKRIHARFSMTTFSFDPKGLTQ